jgi:hypothetical protein
MKARIGCDTRSDVAADDVAGAIRALLDSPEHVDLVALERTLTDGYAHALSLEAERWRIEKRIGEVAAMLNGTDEAAKTKELAELAKRLEASHLDLVALRSLLASLRARAEVARATP